jgi:3-methyl-2-oxobutanoate hydroxymethyltransferase
MDPVKVTVSYLQEKKRMGKKITMLTAYDYPLARILDEAGIDIIFVSDALGMTGLGYKNTFPVNVDDILYHTRAVTNGSNRAFILACMPFMEYVSVEDAVRNARRLIKEGGADGVEIEGGWEVVEIAGAIVSAGVPTMVHIGLTKQHISRYGKFGVIGKTAEEASDLIKLAIECEKAGAFAISLECVPDKVSELISERLEIPVIGIGAGIGCDGQALVSQDMLGLYDKFVPKFVKKYIDLWSEIREAVTTFREEVEELKFPESRHGFSIKSEELKKLKRMLKSRK